MPEESVPVSKGRLPAAGIAGAGTSRAIVLLAQEPAWETRREAATAFDPPRPVSSRSLDPRARAASPSQQMAAISGKTVCTHASPLFDRPEVRSRAQAIVLAGEHGLPLA